MLRRSLILAITALALPASAATGGQPVSLSHSGYLLDAVDAPLDGTVALRLRLYDAATAGALEWEGTCAAVQVAHGYYSVELGGASCPGSGGAGDTVLDTADLPANATRWLEVRVASTTLEPRLVVSRLPAAARASDADTLAGHPPADFAPATHAHDLADLSGLLGAAQGGTGVANASTLTWGTHPIALATSASTSLTLPASGTLATLAGTETLTNKTLSGGTITNVTFASKGITDLATSTALTIASSGSVGIGTSTPASPLTVNGAIRSLSGGFVFPDGSVQLSAVTGGGGGSNATTGGGVDAATLLMLHFDGNVTDSSPSALAMTNGGATFSTSTLKFGSHAAVLNGASNVTSPALTLGTASFSADFWVNFTANSPSAGYQTLFGGGTGGSFLLSAYNGAGSAGPPTSLVLNPHSGPNFLSAPYAFALNTWYHVAATRSGNTFTVYVNGSAIGSASSSVSFPSSSVVVGSAGGTLQAATAVFDEVRLSNSVRWTGNFTPPTAPYSSPGVQLGNVTTCDATTAGTLRWTGVAFQGCDGSGWLNMSTAFSPVDVPGLRLWFKADALSLSNGAAVSTWTDSSGNGHHATQGSATLQPSFVTSAINGKPAVRFDGVNDLLQGPTVNAFDGQNGFSIFAVVKPVTLAGDHKGLFLYGPYGASTNIAFTFHATGGLMFAQRNGCNCVASTATSPVNLTTQLLAAVHDGTQSGTARTRLYRNGVDLTGTVNTSATTPTLNAAFQLGVGNEGNSDDYLNADVAELVVFSTTVSASDRARIQTYLNTKYGIY